MAKLQYTQEQLKGFMDFRGYKAAQAVLTDMNKTFEKMSEHSGELGVRGKELKDTWGSFKIAKQQDVDTLRAMTHAADGTRLGFESMTQQISKAIIKVGFWMVATTAVIGTMRKAQETLQIWKDIEIALERIGITTQTFGRELYNYFEEASDVAIRMGMPIQQVMVGMNLALRATASLEDQAKRTATAQLMLRDAAILGNLAGMQFDHAINVLVGSLRQTGMQLHEGIFLLDKWVAVSRSAQVSINDLAQGFAVMAAAAESAGVNVDQINGLIAALSEAVTLGPVEIGNAIRALMSTLYNPESVKLLQTFGIAARDVTGEFRSFWDIMSELSAMELTGALNPSQLLEISKAAGAGQRRYAQFQAILKNWNIAVEVSEVSANAQNEALLANERIVNTLTNAWDQMTAAQSKFLYAFGETSGSIEDMTKLMQFLARTFDKMSGVDESFATLVKVLGQLVVVFGAVKLAAFAVTKIGLAAWAKSAALSVKAIAPSLVGIGRAQQAPVMSMSWSHQAKTGRTGRLFDPTTGQFVTAPTSTVTTTMPPKTGDTWYTETGERTARQVQVPAIGTQIKDSAHAFGKALVKPMQGVGVTFGVIAGGMIMRELYKSDWAGIGGTIGALAGAKWGIAGMAAGSLIGGAIGKAIEVSTSSAAQLMAKETEAFFKRVPIELRAALRAASEEMDFSKTPIIPLADLGDLQLERLQELLDSEQRTLARRMRDWGLFGYGDWREPDRETHEERMKLPWYSKDAPHILDLEAKILKSQDVIAHIQYSMERLNQASERTTTIYDEQAAEMLKIIEYYGLREAAEKKIADLIEESHNLSESFLASQIRLAGAMPTAQAKLLAQLQQFAPHLADEFRKSYSDFDTFFEIDPMAYEPLQQALATLTTLTQEQEGYNKKIEETRRVLEELGFTWSDVHSENATLIAEQKKHWSDLLDRVLRYGHSLEDFYIPWKLEALPDAEKPDAAKVKLQELVRLIEEGDEAWLQWVLNLSKVLASTAVLEKNFKQISTHIPQGRLEFLPPDANVAQIQAALDKYSIMLKSFIKEGEPETYHAFVRDEVGVLQGHLATFKAQPEVWSAMLGELRGIEKNTRDALEAEYNIPSWYQTPTRYWAMKETGMKEGFGPEQRGFWQLWKEFLATSGGATAAVLSTAITQGADATKVATDFGDAASYATEQVRDLTAELNGMELGIDYGASAMIQAAGEYLKDTSKIGEDTGETIKEAIDDASQSATRFAGVVGWAIGIWNTLTTIINSIRVPETTQNYPEGGGGGGNHPELIPMQHGGVVPETGPYYLHRQEVVSSVSDIKSTNALLGSSYKVLLISQNYLSSINMGISGIRQELALLRQQAGHSKSEGGFTEFRRVTNTGYVGVNSLGTRRV